jgi:hypothetical protein
VQSEPQLMPAGALVTVPEPDPVVVTARERSELGGGGWTSKVAVAARAALIVSVQVLVPEQSPDQPEKSDPGSAVAVSVTEVPSR